MKFAAIVSLALGLTFSIGQVNAAITYGPAFDGFYSNISLGTPPGVPTPLGGLTLLAGDSNTLLIGGKANNTDAGIYSIGLTRDANQHIIGFSGSGSLFANASQIDGGLAYAPNGVLMYTVYPVQGIGQIKPGSTGPDRVDGVLNLRYSVGSLTFVPAGFNGAGQLKVVSYNFGDLGTLPYTPAGDGTYDLGTTPIEVTLTGGPEGIAYVHGTNPGFGGVDSMLVAEYDSGKVGAYDIDATGNPILATRRDFITGLNGAEGAFIDPISGDFLFSTFNSGNEVFVIRGFIPPAPEPSSIILGIGAMAAVAVFRNKRGRR